MDINTKCDLVQKDVYLYDMKSCYYKISETVFYDLRGIDKDDKEARNIALGKEQIDNPNLQKFLADEADSIIDYYLHENGILPEDIILRQRDGFIINQLLIDNNSLMKIDLREHICTMIITLDRKKYLTISDQGVTVKGMPNKYEGIDKFYNKLQNLNLFSKKGLFKQLKKLKEEFFSTTDINVFLIKRGDKDLLITKRAGLIEVKSKNILLKAIDRQKYYDLYLRDFIDPLILYYF